MADSAVLAQLMLDVYDITNRPDLVAETRNAIKRVTLKEHNADTYPSDLAILAPITPTSTAADNFRYSVSIPTSLANYRRLAWIKEYVANPGIYGGYNGRLDFNLINPEHIFDDYAVERQNYYYVAGDAIVLKAARAVTALQIAYYKRPIVDSATFASWIADRFPYVISEAAAGEVFKMIGKDDEAAKYKASGLANRLDITKAEIGDEQ